MLHIAERRWGCGGGLPLSGAERQRFQLPDPVLAVALAHPIRGLEAVELVRTQSLVTCEELSWW